jgi:hypothetical protein
MNSKMTFAATSLLLAGVLAVSFGCASTEESNNGGSSGNNSSSSAAGGGGGGSSSSSSGGGGSVAPSGDEVTFAKGQAKGMFSGYGWVAMGSLDSLSSPTCEGATISSSSPCKTTTTWSKDDAVCMTGSIPALPSPAVQADYDNNWGVQIGVNAKDPSDAIGDALKDYTSVAFTLSGSPSSGLRAMLHRKGDPDGTTYCADSIKTDTAIKFTKFNTKCWGGEPTTVYLTADDLPKIDKAGVQVSSTSSPITVTDLCLSKITFSK